MAKDFSPEEKNVEQTYREAYQRLDESDMRAVQETAKKLGLSEQEVNEVLQRLGYR